MGRVFFDFQPTNRAFKPKFLYFALVRYAWKLVYHWPENVIWRNNFVFRFCDFFFLIIKVFAVEVRYFPSKNYVFFFFNAFFLPGHIYWWHNFSEFLKTAYLQTHSHPLQEWLSVFLSASRTLTLWRVPILSQSTWFPFLKSTWFPLSWPCRHFSLIPCSLSSLWLLSKNVTCPS